MTNNTYEQNVAQGMASYINYLNDNRLCELMNALDSILTKETEDLAKLTLKSSKALENLNLSKMEINNLIKSNRGGTTGVHGFIAEFAETGIRNSRDVFQGLQESTKLLNNNGSADLLLHGKEAQMKFYANILEGIKQATNYREMMLVIPKDQMDVVEKIMEGYTDIVYNDYPLSATKISNIRHVIDNESSIRGVSFDEWLKPSINNYRDIQKNTIKSTLSSETKNIKKLELDDKNEITKSARNERICANQAAQPSFKEATKVAGIGVAVQGGFNFGDYIFKKHKKGKEVWEFNSKEWIECGVTTMDGATRGGLTGYAIYGLTNVCHLAAPSAAALTSGTIGLTETIIKFRNGDIDDDGFIDLVTFNAIDASGVAIGAAVGQMIVPLPVVGALIGSIIASTSLKLGKDMFNEHELQVIEKYQEKVNLFIEQLEVEHKLELEQLLNEYSKLDDLQQYSFNLDLNINLRFITSINFALSVGVPADCVLKNEREIDAYFLDQN